MQERRQKGRGVPLSELDPELTETSRRVIGCAIEVHKALGPGYDEPIYAQALQHELKREGIAFDTSRTIDVRYGDAVVGTTTIDMVIDDRFIVDLMAEPVDIGSYARSKLRAQLRASDLELGLIVNFAERRLKDGLVRVLNPDKIARDDDGPDDEHEDE
ncbi:MAG: GxxExxY protein [Phycisphaerales bacterium]|nr:GxxExxY protein [Phycisphaerales bacterium]